MSLNTQIGTNVFSVEIITNTTTYLLDGSSVEYVYLIEDIFSFSISGKLSFTDRVGIMESGSLTGDEIYRVTFGNTNGSGEYRTIDMKMYKIDKVTPKTKAKMHSVPTFELLLVDQYFQLFNSNGWHKSWADTQISKIIRDISKNHLGITNFGVFEETKESIEHFDTHLKTPSECLMWLMRRSSGITSGQSGYLMYRYNNGNFGHAVTTLENLLAQKNLMLPQGENNIYGFEQQNTTYVNKIQDFKLLQLDLNALKSLSGGSLLGYDIRRKKLIKRDYTYQDAIDRFTILGRKTLFPRNIFIDKPKKKIDGYSNEDILDNIWYGNWIKEYCNQQLMEITVQGHEKRHAGGMIRILWPSVDEKIGILNKQMDGKYLVKSVTHYLSNNVTGGYKQRMVCIKNGYGESSNKDLVKATKFNI